MTTARGFIGAGDVYLNRIESGVKQGVTGPYYANKFEVKPNLKKLQLTSFALATYGQVLEDVSVQGPGSFTIELSETNSETIADSLFGTITPTSQSAGTLTAEVLIAKLGAWVPLSKDTLTGAQVVTNSGGGTTYTLGVDYEVNKPMGWIRALAGGAISDAQSLKVTTDYGAFTGSKIAALTNGPIHAEIIFVGINLVDQTPCIVKVHEGIIANDTALDFLLADFGVRTLPGTMVQPVGATEQFTVELRSA